MRSLALIGLLFSCTIAVAQDAPPAPWSNVVTVAVADVRSPVPSSPYNAAYDRALAGRRHLIVWVGVSCVACEHKLATCDHCHVATWRGDGTQRVVVGRYEDGQLWLAAELRGLPSVGEIVHALYPSVAQASGCNCAGCDCGGAGACSGCSSGGCVGCPGCGTAAAVGGGGSGGRCRGGRCR